MATKAGLPALQGSGLRDFSGGPNLRDAPPELAANEGIDAYNVTFDERGGVSSRLGYVKYNGSVYGGGAVQNAYYSSAAGALIVQAGSSLYKGTSTSANKTFTTGARVGMVDFVLAAGTPVLCAIHPVDGLFTSVDGVTFVAVADVDAPKGNVLEVWQNKLWAAGNPTTPSQVTWSNAGAADTWTNTDFVQLRSKDNLTVVALKVASGLDISGRSGLICCKQESSYRIYDASTGTYEVVDATVGAASALAVTSIGPKLLVLDEHGIFSWQNGQVGFTNESDRLRPLWDPAQIDTTKLALFCAGRAGTRAKFSLCRFGSTANDLAFEYHPDQGWVAPRSDAMSCYATVTAGGGETVYGGSPTVSGQVYELDTGGTDDGAAISWRWQSRWIELNSGFQASMWQIRIHGRGEGTVTFRVDYSIGDGDDFPFDLTGTGPNYDSGYLYDSGNFYSDPASQLTQALYTLGLARQFSLEFSGSSSTTAEALQVFGSGASPVIGAFGLYGFEWLHTPLGLS
jgi:hypothetical protein